MRKIIEVLTAAVMLCGLMVVASCHSTEANYKASYDKAVEQSRSGEKGEIYMHDLEVRSRNNYVVDGDSIRMLRHHFNVVDDSAQKAKAFGVVVAEFKQKFNALSYRDRLREENLDSYVVYISRSKLYCVVAQGYDDLSVAATFSRNPEKYMKLKVLVPKAWVLQRY